MQRQNCLINHADRAGCLALLRATIGQTQQEFAELVGCSLPTIRAIEQRKLALSEKLAQKLSDETGVRISWLLDGDATRPPSDANEVLVTKESFEQHQVNLVRRRIPLPPEERTGQILAKNCRLLMSILVSAERHGNQDLCGYKIGEALEELKKQFGSDQEFAPKPVSQGGRILLHGWLEEWMSCMKMFSKRRRVLKPQKRAARARSQSKPTTGSNP